MKNLWLDELMNKHALGNRMTKWDIRFLTVAKLVSTWSKDPSTQCGAVIVRPDKTIVSVGFNGFPKNMLDIPALYENREEKYSRIVHCEVNALIHAGEPVKDCTLYTYPFACCDRCAVQMIQSGITRFVNPELPDDKAERWKAALEKTVRYYAECGVQHVEYKSCSNNSAKDAMQRAETAEQRVRQLEHALQKLLIDYEIEARMIDHELVGNAERLLATNPRET